MLLLLTLLFLLSLPSICLGHGGHEPERKTLMISLDAFRWDYVERIRHLVGQENSNIWRLIHRGAFASKGVTSAFTTITFPNHYTLVTGLYEESHGVVSNIFYDPDLNLTADLKRGLSKWAYGGEPIWKTLLKQTATRVNGDVVGCVMWIACQFGGLKNFVPYNESVAWKERIELAIDWLVRDSTQFVLMYYHEPDQTGHFYGPDSKEMNKTLISLDMMIGELIEKLEQKDLFEEINLLIVSDHGMSAAVEDTPILPERVPNDMFTVWSREPALWLVEPAPGRHNETVDYFKKFPHLSVIEKARIPDRWHYKNNHRIPSLLLLADRGYSLSGHMKGYHGYDNDLTDMRPTLIAHGPAFIANSTIPPEMGTVDVYLLLCAILHLLPAPNNGTIDHFRSFLRPMYYPASTEFLYHGISFVTMAVSVSVALFALLACACHWQRKSVSIAKNGRGRTSEANGYLYRALNLESVGPLLTTASAGADLDDSDDYEDSISVPRRP